MFCAIRLRSKIAILHSKTFKNHLTARQGRAKKEETQPYALEKSRLRFIRAFAKTNIPKAVD